MSVFHTIRALPPKRLRLGRESSSSPPIRTPLPSSCWLEWGLWYVCPLRRPFASTRRSTTCPDSNRHSRSGAPCDAMPCRDSGAFRAHISYFYVGVHFWCAEAGDHLLHHQGCSLPWAMFGNKDPNKCLCIYSYMGASSSGPAQLRRRSHAAPYTYTYTHAVLKGLKYLLSCGGCRSCVVHTSHPPCRTRQLQMNRVSQCWLSANRTNKLCIDAAPLSSRCNMFLMGSHKMISASIKTSLGEAKHAVMILRQEEKNLELLRSVEGE